MSPNNQPEQAPEKMITMAEQAFRDDEPKKALKFLAPALTIDPVRPEWLDLLKRIVTTTEAVLDLCEPQSKERYFADEAVRAWIYNHLGRTGEALDILFEVNLVRPDIPYIALWVPEWLEQEDALETVDTATFNKILHCFSPFPELWETNALQLNSLQRMVPIFNRFRLKGQTDAASNYLMSSVLRKAGHPEDALDLARSYYASHPGWLSAVALASNLEKPGRFEEAIPLLEAAKKERPGDMVFYLELAETCAEAGQYGEALRYCKYILDHHKENPQAMAVATWCRIKIQGQKEEWLDALHELAVKGNRLAGRYFNRFTPYHGFLPEPTDALARVFSRFWNKMKDQSHQLTPGMARTSLRYLESPSNLIAFELWHPDLLAVEVALVPDPDPRYPAAEVDYLLWQYDGMIPIPALPEPSERVLAQIALLAQAPFEAEQNLAAAANAAVALGSENILDILATIIYPPPVPENLNPMTWLQRVQHAAVLVLSQIDRGWAGSLRRKLLIDLAMGPMDWVKVPVLMVLARFARDLPESREEVRKIFQTLNELIPQQGGGCYTHTLYYLWSSLEGAPEPERAWAWRRLEEWLEEQQNSQSNLIQ